MKIYIPTAAVVFAMLVAFHLVGCNKIETDPRDASATDALLVSKAQSTSSAVSALNSLDNGDVKVARSTLEAQVISGITVLRALESEQTSASAEVIAQAINEAEAYMKRHGLTVPAPSEKK